MDTNDWQDIDLGDIVERSGVYVVSSENIEYIEFRPHVHVDSTDRGVEYPEYILESARIASFREWPKGLKQKPEQLSDAGFFYTKVSDRVVCFHCGIGIRAWEDQDEPWEEHAKYSPLCKYLLIVKGKEFVGEVQQRFLAVRNQEKESEAEQTKSNTEQVPEEDENEKCCEKWDAKLREWRSCKICFENEYNTVFMPCGHMMVCGKCASALTHCPNCRILLEKIVRVYFP